MTAPCDVVTDLPIEPLLPKLREVLAQGTTAVLQAPPGAGKTTRVPLAIADEPWLAGRKIVMLEPRRLAARAAAKRMAEMLGERVGDTVGYRVRLDSAVGKRTRIEVVTAGVFLRQIQDDPSLDGIGAVLFDEFHERSLDVDLGLALAIDAGRALREDLRILAMSATLEGEPIARLLGREPSAPAPILTSEGRRFPVETRYLPREPTTRLDETVTAAIRRAMGEEDGDILVFLPGVGDIRRVEERMIDVAAPEVDIVPLYSDLPLDRQDAAIRPAPAGRRKVVLATSIAETSLTIEGVRAVIDSGYMRVPRFDPGTGMSRLETVRVSRASADQRRGRAGRLGPGVCYRLWTEPSDRALVAQTPPEIVDADLAPLALELAAWGAGDPTALAWLDPPPASALASARDLLRRLGALDDRDAITDEGRRLVKLGVHPRLAHMLLRGQAAGLGALAADIAALLGERDILRGGARDVDLRHRVDLLRSRARAAQPVAQVARHWRRQLGVEMEASMSDGVGVLVALAYPDRIAQRRSGTRGQFRLANGRGAVLAETDPLAGEDFLAVAALDGAGANARIFLAAPITEAELRRVFADQLIDTDVVRWDTREAAVVARRQRRLGELVLDDAPLDAPPESVLAAVLEGIRQLGMGALPWTKDLRMLQARVAFLRRVEPEAWPDLSDIALADRLEEWLAPYLAGVRRQAHFERIDLVAAVTSLLSWEQRRALDAEAPTHLVVPTGSRIPIDYSGESPVLAVRLQEMFGLAQTPALGRGRVPLLIHLLSPAGRPVQVTSDLASFWRGAYADVKKDLKGQYPKHFWPDDPLAAAPTRRAKPRGR